jgi:RNA polymerase sigma-70 factor (ECF subfamily)
MNSAEDHRRFERLVLPHLDAAYNLARWLTFNDDDAQDVVQDAMLRALRYMDSCRGDDAKAWVLQIVRNTCYSWLKEHRPSERLWLGDEDDTLDRMPAPQADEPQEIAMRNADMRQVNEAIAALPVPFRDVLVLREIEELAYTDIARIAGVPVGTVMSRLARARAMLREALTRKPALRVVPASRNPQDRRSAG